MKNNNKPPPYGVFPMNVQCLLNLLFFSGILLLDIFSTENTQQASLKDAGRPCFMLNKGLMGETRHRFLFIDSTMK